MLKKYIKGSIIEEENNVEDQKAFKLIYQSKFVGVSGYGLKP